MSLSAVAPSTAKHGAASVEAMRAIKRAIDPNGIMNPEKIV